ncbi:MAG TPA: glycoside hydrolase family 88 protein [Opitutaceae bacterium]|nr:glycoside hydrolase family 88 protein [Opitutaceae bacterium]
MLATLAGLLRAAGTNPSLQLPSHSAILATISSVNNYWIQNNSAGSVNNYWDGSVCVLGDMAAYDATGNSNYLNYGQAWASAHTYSLLGGDTTRNANNQTAGEVYVRLYQILGTSSDLTHITADVKSIINSSSSNDWTWVDTLNMAMPVFAELGQINADPAYAAKMYSEYSHTKSSLYDQTKSLWWRDSTYVGTSFWSRGNAWAFVALAKVLETLPTNDPHYADYLSTFQAMAAKLITLQQSDGFWYANLTNPSQFGTPETSGTAGFTYGLAWGVNSGALDSATYLPAVTKAWNGMVTTAVHTNGFLGYVQGVGTAPGPSSSTTTADFGVGLFLQAGKEVAKLATAGVAAPTFSPPAGTYTSALSVTITSATSGASIAYTTDGSTPTESGGTVTHGTALPNGGSISISTTTTLNAVAYETGMTDSAVTPGLYTINPQLAPPTFNPPGGTYTSAQPLVLSDATPGATIYYSINGTPYSPYTGSISLPPGTSTVFAYAATATGSSYTYSPVVSATYKIITPVTAPTFSPPAGTYTSALSVTITSATSGATIAYTTDGSTPTESGGTVTHGIALSNGGSVSISTTTTLNAMAYETGMTDSAVTPGLYNINVPQVATPTFTPPAGTYTSAQLVTITSATSGASIAYTTDGSTPTESGGTVTHGTALSNGGSVSISTSTTLNAMAYKTGMTDSTVFSAHYAINSLQAPVISSPDTASGTVGVPFSYQIIASNSPTSYGATGLPTGFSVDTSTGLISGTPGAPGISSVTLSATNAGGTGTQALMLKIEIDWTLAGTADFNGDGKPDLILQNTVNGQRAIWLMSDTTYVSSVSLGTITPDWQIAGAADFNGDGKPDLIWQNTKNGQRAIWLMNGTTYLRSVSLGTVTPDWQIAGAADFNGDGNSDLIWQNTKNGQRAIWLMNGTTYLSSVSLGTVTPDWDIVGAADFNGDGNSDLIWQNTKNGQRGIWLMNGTTYVSSIGLGTVSTDWNLVGAADFNGDGKPDLIWQDTASDECAIWLMNGATYVGSATFRLGLP